MTEATTTLTRAADKDIDSIKFYVEGVDGQLPK